LASCEKEINNLVKEKESPLEQIKGVVASTFSELHVTTSTPATKRVRVVGAGVGSTDARAAEVSTADQGALAEACVKSVMVKLSKMGVKAKNGGAA
jgi:hypothetical protein